MFRRDQFGVVFNSVFSLAFAGFMTAFSLFAQKSLTPESFCTGLVTAFAINFVLGTYIPLLPMGNGFARLFIKNEKSPVFYLLRMLAIVFVMTACMSFLVMFTQIGFHAELIFAFFGSFPVSFLAAYVFAVIIFPFLLKLTQALCTKG